MGTVLSAELAAGYIVVVESDEFASDPRASDPIGRIYGDHRRFTIGDGRPPGAELRALERGGMPLLRRYLRRACGALAFVGVGMIDHSGVTFYPVEPGESAVHRLDPGGWDSGAVGYSYVTRRAMVDAGLPADDLTAERAREILADELAEWSAWANGDCYAWRVVRPCPDPRHAGESPETIADCPHSETVESVGGYIGDEPYVRREGIATAESLAGART